MGLCSAVLHTWRGRVGGPRIALTHDCKCPEVVRACFSYRLGDMYAWMVGMGGEADKDLGVYITPRTYPAVGKRKLSSPSK
jgi:hypothetical protein